MLYLSLFCLIATTPFTVEEDLEAESVAIVKDKEEADEAEDGELIFDDEVVAELEDDLF